MARIILPTVKGPDGKLTVVRGALEIGLEGLWHPVDEDLLIRLRSDQEFHDQAIETIRVDIKEALWGLAAIFGEEHLITLCRKIIAEDFDPHGEQTPFGEEADALREKRSEAAR